MKAIVIHHYGPPDVLKYESVPDPEPRAGEIRIRIHAATVNRVLDVSLRAGNERARLGVRHALVFEHLRRAVVVDDDRFHAPPSSVRIFQEGGSCERRLAPSIDDDAVRDALPLPLPPKRGREKMWHDPP